MLDLRRLHVLHEFSLRGTIAATAEALGYTASAVSQQLATLEREVGTPLVDRTARSATLTDAGRLLAGHAEQILAMVEAAESVLQEQTEVPSGQVTVTAFPTAAVAFAPALAHSLSVHPELQLQLRQTLEANGERLVTQGDADIALVDDWSGRRPDQSGALRFYHLFRDPMILIVPVDHPFADATQPVDLRRLRSAPWLTTPRGEPSRTATERILAEIDATPAATLEFEGLSTILSLVARGIGIAAVPQLSLATEPSTVAHRAIVGSPPTRDVYAVVRATSVRRPSIAATLRAIHSAARELRRTALTSDSGP
jgi:DNA-binding transcriptional LysR family regulator